MKPCDNMLEQETEIVKNNWVVRWLIIVLAVFFVLAISWGGFMFVLMESYAGKIFPNIRIANFNVGGFTYEQAKELLQEKVDYLDNQGMQFVFENHQVSVLPTSISPTDPDMVKVILTINTRDALNQAWQFGRQRDLLTNFRQQLEIIFNGRSIGVDYQLNEEELREILKENFQQFEIKASPASLSFDGDKVAVNKEKQGREFDYDLVVANLDKGLSELSFELVEMILRDVDSEIKQEKAAFLINRAQNLIDRAPLRLTYSGTDIVKKWEYQAKSKEWEIDRQDIEEWLGFSINQHGLVELVFERDKMNEFLENVNNDIFVESTEARFEVATSSQGALKVGEFQASSPGQELDRERTVERLNELIVEEGQSEVRIALVKTEAKITTDNVNDLGVKELIGQGESGYIGSPVNRRHNIKNGADSINGLLIKPDEEFSLITALGEINAESGYIPELVIKGNKTIPEYGGGLCQIGTTLFRAVINSGLPITERRNHSYRVSYYEPAGTDATIYNPKPDLRFINDTGNYLLLQTHVFEDSSNLVFEFWGTADGRLTSTTEPVIYNIVKPGPTKYIETEDLAPGDKKCTERAHNGADAYFKRFIRWPEFLSRESIEETWESHYVPWREVCLIGVEKKATSTEESVISN